MTLTQELIKYSNDIISSNIIACKKHKWACMRFLGDIERQGTADFPYVFVESKAERFLNWARLFKHTKGELSGQLIEPDIIHKFIFGNVYGWVNINTGYRRFNKIYWQVARKNTKSQWLSIVASYELMAFDESGTSLSEVYCAATKSDQAKIVYNETVNMLKKSEFFRGKYKETYGRLFHIKSGSFMRPLSEEDRRTGDGYNPQCGIIDEYHAHETSEMYDILDSGMGARPEPLLVIITTAGFDLNAPCYRVEYDLVSKILSPDIDVTIDNYFVMICELDFNDTPDSIEIDGKTIKPGELIDDITDEKCWIKANPIICSYEVGINFLRKALKEALEAPEKMRNFLTKHMNHWINMRELGYMDMAKWNACKGEIPDLHGESFYMGADLSSKLDLSSITFEFFVDGKNIILAHSFIPEDTALRKEKTDKVQYRRWADEGWLTLIPGAVIDEDVIIEWICNKIETENWIPTEDCLDPWGTVTLASKLIDKGHNVVNIIQGPKTLSEPTKDFRYKVYDRKIIHDGNPLLSWAMSNAIVDVIDRNENIILNKKKSRQRIDPVAATINAHVRAMLCEPESSAPTVLFF